MCFSEAVGIPVDSVLCMGKFFFNFHESKYLLLKGKSGLKIIFLKLVYFYSSSPKNHFCENSLLFYLLVISQSHAKDQSFCLKKTTPLKENISFNIHDVNTWKENLSKKKEKLKLS